MQLFDKRFVLGQLSLDIDKMEEDWGITWSTLPSEISGEIEFYQLGYYEAYRDIFTALSGIPQDEEDFVRIQEAAREVDEFVAQLEANEATKQ